MPEDFIADDSKETGVWRKVQINRSTSLRKHDRLYLVAFDESWAAEAIVIDAIAEPLARNKQTQFLTAASPTARPRLAPDRFDTALDVLGVAAAVENGRAVVRR